MLPFLGFLWGFSTTLCFEEKAQKIKNKLSKTNPIMKKTLFLFFFSTFASFSQDLKLSSLLIPKELTENANSVVRKQKIEINILSQKLMQINKSKIITVLNSKGLNNIDAIEYYDESTKVKTIEATIYSALGTELKKIRRKDFKDQSVADGFSVYNDNRMVYLDYTPTEYPFTIVYTSEVETSNTAFIPTWYPIDDYYESIQESSITVKYVSDLGFKFKERNFTDDKIKKTEQNQLISYQVENYPAKKNEELSPSFIKNNPSVLFALDYFNLEGYQGSAKNWNEFSSWVYNSLLKDTESLPEATIAKIKALVGTEQDPIKKAKIVYRFVQEKTRYVSVQMGIGGWKPMLAADVDRLGYGDCKALSNYTRVLLKSVGVDAYYTIIYGGNNKQNILDDFVAMQGNHAILSIPYNNSYISLECTSQTSPFGFNGNFTDDRYALVVKPDGGEIVKTTDYNDSKSKQIIKAFCKINDNGDLVAKLNYKSNGVQYEQRNQVESKSKENQELYYKEMLKWLNTLKINSIVIKNDKEAIEFIEDLDISVPAYASISNGLMFNLNIFNRTSFVPQRYRTRLNSFEINTGFFDEDEVEIEIPKGYVVEAKPDDIVISDKFGTYKMEIKSLSDNKLLYKRSYLLNKGSYQKEEYEKFRSFSEKVSRTDNSKIILTKL
mgnify:FL=1